jgi:cytochrome c
MKLFDFPAQHRLGRLGALLLLCGLALAAARTQAADPATPVLDQRFVASKNCLSCHSVKRRIVGPAFQDIAKKYAGQPEAAARLAEKIRLGGVGAWGPIPMPANPKVNAQEARQLADWVLQQPQ